MPKFDQENITARPQVDPEQGQRPQLDVVASPVNTYVSPAENNLMRLSQSLGIFAGGAEKMLQVKDKVDYKQDVTKGQALKMSGDALPQEATPGVQMGYRQMSGQMLGVQDHADTLQWIDENKHDPQFQANAPQLIRQHVASKLEGITDPEMQRAMMPMLMSAEASGVQQVNQLVTAQQRAQVGITHQALTSAAFGDGQDLTADGIFKSITQANAGFVGKDITPQEMDKNTFQSLNEYIKSGHPEAFDMVTKKDEGGTSFAERNPERVVTLENTRNRAISNISSADREAHTADVLKNTQDFEKLVADPLAIPESSIVGTVMGGFMGNTRLFKDVDEAKAGVKRLQEARLSALEADGNLDIAEKTGDALVLNGKGKSAFVTKYEQPLWEQAAMSGDYAGAFKASNGLMSRFYGYFDPRASAHVSAALNSAIMDKEGPPQVTKAFGVVFDQYKNLVASHRQDILDNQFDTHAKQMMERVTDLTTVTGMPMADALRAYRDNLNNPEKAKLAEKTFNQEHQIKFEKDLHSSLNPLGPTGEPINKDEVVVQASSIVRDLVKSGVPLEQAMKYSKDHVMDSFVRVGDNSVLASPVILNKYGVDKVSFTKGAEGLLEQVAKGRQIDSKELSLKAINGGERYMIYRNGFMMIGSASMNDIKDKSQEAVRQSKANVALNQSMADEVREATTFAQMKTDGRLTVDQLVTLGAKADAAYKAGQLRPEEYDAFKRERDAAVGKAHSDAMAHAQQLSQGVLGGLLRQGNQSIPPDNFVPPRNAGGNNLPTANYARSMSMQGDLTGSMIAATEGLSTKWVKDNKGNQIGYGYNDRGRSPEQIRSDLKTSGVPAGDVENVMNNLVQITPAQAQRLSQLVVQREFLPTIYKTIPKAEFDSMPKNVQAVITHLAYNVGDPAKFPKALDALQKGDLETASKHLMVHYEKDGKMVENVPQFNLYKRMLQGETTWNNYLGSMIQRQGNK